MPVDLQIAFRGADSLQEFVKCGLAAVNFKFVAIMVGHRGRNFEC